MVFVKNRKKLLKKKKKKKIFTEKNRNLENSYIFFSEKYIYFFSSSFATFEQP